MCVVRLGFRALQALPASTSPITVFPPLHRLCNAGGRKDIKDKQDHPRHEESATVPGRAAAPG